ncbi:MAG: hypothetical protein KBD76_00955 [Bacteriovorax sp.]|nr:hypothetical protein [Bacteriovorax sp.]
MLKKSLFLTALIGLFVVTLFFVAIAPFHIYTLTLTEGVSTRFLTMKPSSLALYDGHDFHLANITHGGGDNALYAPIHFSNFILPLPINHPSFTFIPNIKMDGSGPRLGASFLDGKRNELISFMIERNVKLETTLGEQKIFQLPVFKNYILRKGHEEFWGDLFSKGLSLPASGKGNFFESLLILRKVSYSDLVYNLYVLYNRTHLLPADTMKISFDNESKHGLVELVSPDPLYRLEKLYLIDQGIIYSLKLKTKIGHEGAEHFRNKLLKETRFKNSTTDSAVAIYAQYKNISYEQRVDQMGMSYLFAAWSHDLLNKEFVRVIILFLERGKSNLIYLKPFYEYAYKRFGSNLSSENEYLMETPDQKLKRQMHDELEGEVKKEELSNTPKFEGSVNDPNEKIKLNLQKARENKNNSDDSEKMLLQE